MRSNVFVIGILAVCICSLALAEVPAGKMLNGVENVYNGDANRQAGTVGNVTVSLTQTGPLAADVVLGWDTTPGVYATLYTSYDAFLLYGQVYDTPWIGGCNTSTGSTSCNDFISGTVHMVLGTVPSNSYSETFSFTVPVADTYQGWGIVYGGWSPGVPWLSGSGQNTGFWLTSSNLATAYSSPGYIDAVQPTDNPDAGGEPIPTMNRWGILAMIGMLLGVAVLVIIRRK